MMQFNVNLRPLLLGAVAILSLAAFGANEVFTDARQAFGAGWIAFGPLLLACSPKRRS